MSNTNNYTKVRNSHYLGIFFFHGNFFRNGHFFSNWYVKNPAFLIASGARR